MSQASVLQAEQNSESMTVDDLQSWLGDLNVVVSDDGLVEFLKNANARLALYH